MIDLLQRAVAIADGAHRGQTTKTGEPYINHVGRVAEPFLKLAIIAELHDVVEDSDVTLKTLRAAGFSEEIVGAVDALTRREGESYKQYLRRCAENESGIIVKVADIQDHLDSRGGFEGRSALMKRYRKALEYLEE
jgi:(p)ppGpp synthase/HD superfamily hydrolase